jgi:hypothetical protein
MRTRFKFLNSELGLAGLATLPLSAVAWVLFRRWRRSSEDA